MHPDILNQMKQIEGLQDNWNSYESEKPSTVAIINTKAILKWMEESQFSPQPTQLFASAAGGIAIVFLKDGLYADVECFNDGDIVGILLHHDNISDVKTRAFEIASTDGENLAHSMKQLQAFLS